MKEKIKELGKRLLTIAVALAMVVTCIPGTAFGAEISEKVKKNVRVPDTFTGSLCWRYSIIGVRHYKMRL